ncbi:MAG TPA: response regulator [Bryobacteraceae bacterium]|jgi:DNA-binding response OmpR family regulator|nr:response regulator [Bryobacteraceae bacterium]
MKTVLIVEDSEACAETLQIALESLPGVKTVIVRSAAAALDTLQREDAAISALVTDLHMPKNNGFDLIRGVRTETRYARLPILMISGDSDPRLPQRALELGADAFFPKPYSPAAVRRKLEQLLC